MGRKQRVIIGFAGIFISFIVGAISAKSNFSPGQFLAFIAGVFFFFGAYRAVFSGEPQDNGESTGRLASTEMIERRLTDIQDVVLSIDDRLTRLESSSRAVPQEAR